MNTLFSTQTWHLLGWTMLHFLWLGTALLIVVAVVRLALRRAGANVRYAHSLATLLALAMIPLVTAAWLASSAPPSAGEGAIWFADSGASDSASALPIPSTDTGIASGTQIIELNLDYNPNESAGPITPPPPSAGEGLGEGAMLRADSAVASSATGSASDPPMPPTNTGIANGTLEHALAYIQFCVPYLPYLWLIGTPITFALLATGLIGAERMRRHGAPLTDGPVHEACERLRRSLRITRHVALAACDRVAQPVLVGIVRPLILLPPVALTGWSPDELEMVLLHELAHVRRWDNLINLAQRVIESLLFFHPAVWMVSTWVRRDREECCDAVVVARTAQPKQYAELLVSLATQQPLAGLALARHPLAARLRRILKLEDEPMLVSRNTLGLLAITVAVAIYMIAVHVPSPIIADDTPATESEPLFDPPPPSAGEQDISDNEVPPSSTDVAHESTPTVASSGDRFTSIYQFDEDIKVELEKLLDVVEFSKNASVKIGGEEYLVITAPSEEEHDRIAKVFERYLGDKAMKVEDRHPIKQPDNSAAKSVLRVYQLPAENGKELEVLGKWLQSRKNIKVEPVPGDDDRAIITIMATEVEHEAIAKVLTDISSKLPFLTLEDQDVAPKVWEANPGPEAVPSTDPATTPAEDTPTFIETEDSESPPADTPFDPTAERPAPLRERPTDRIVMAHEIPQEFRSLVDRWAKTVSSRRLWAERDRFVMQASRDRHDQLKSMVGATLKWRDADAARSRARNPLVTLEREEKVLWRTIGLTFQRETPVGVALRFLDQEEVEEDITGVEVAEVAPGSPAAWQDVRPGDVLTNVDGFGTARLPELVSVIQSLLQGFEHNKELELQFLRPAGEDRGMSTLPKRLPLRPDEAEATTAGPRGWTPLPAVQPGVRAPAATEPAPPQPVATRDELEVLREHVKFIEGQFKRIDALFQAGARGGSAEKRDLAAYTLSFAQGELALAEGRRKEALAKFEEARTHAEQATKTATIAYANDAVSYDYLLQAAKNLAEIKRKIIHLQAKPSDVAVPQPIQPQKQPASSTLPQWPSPQSPNSDKHPPPPVPADVPVRDEPTSAQPVAPPILMPPSAAAPPVSPYRPPPTAATPVYRYDGKTFQEWRDLWKHELSTERRIEAVKALAAFGRVGYAKEAAEAILDVAGEYDFSTTTSGTSTIIKGLRSAIVNSFTGSEPRIDDAVWFPMMMERFHKQPKKWQGLLGDILGKSDGSVDAKFAEQIQPLTQNSESNLRSAALSWLFYKGHKNFDSCATAALTDPAPQVVENALRLLAIQQQNKSANLDDRDDDQTAGLDFDVLLTVLTHSNADVQKSARRTLRSMSPFHRAEMANALVAISVDQTRTALHLPVIRALGSLGESGRQAVPQLESILNESDELGLRVAAAVSIDEIESGGRGGGILLKGVTDSDEQRRIIQLKNDEQLQR